MKNETIYRRKGWTDKTFEGIAMGDGTVSLLNESGEVVVSGLEFIANPEDVTADDLPGSFATGKSPGKSKAAPPVVDLEKAAAVVAKIRDQAESDPFLPGDLNKLTCRLYSRSQVIWSLRVSRVMPSPEISRRRSRVTPKHQSRLISTALLTPKRSKIQGLTFFIRLLTSPWKHRSSACKGGVFLFN